MVALACPGAKLSVPAGSAPPAKSAAAAGAAPLPATDQATLAAPAAKGNTPSSNSTVRPSPSWRTLPSPRIALQLPPGACSSATSSPNRTVLESPSARKRTEPSPKVKVAPLDTAPAATTAPAPLRRWYCQPVSSRRKRTLPSPNPAA